MANSSRVSGLGYEEVFCGCFGTCLHPDIWRYMNLLIQFYSPHFTHFKLDYISYAVMLQPICQTNTNDLVFLEVHSSAEGVFKMLFIDSDQLLCKLYVRIFV